MRVRLLGLRQRMRRSAVGHFAAVAELAAFFEEERADLYVPGCELGGGYGGV
jgi:hypothetical protein